MSDDDLAAIIRSQLDSLEEKTNAARERRRAEMYDADYATRRMQASLFFDDSVALDFLAAERFPDEPGAADYRYKISNGEVLYLDDDNTWRPEFNSAEHGAILKDYVYPNLADAGIIFADVAGAMAGASKGFSKAMEYAKSMRHPVAAGATLLAGAGLGGFLGTVGAGGTARSARLAIPHFFYDAPPEEIWSATKDLGLSSLMSAIPFGAGPARNLANKFLGQEDSLRMLLKTRGSAEEKMKEAAEMGIKLTLAEAAEAGMGASAVRLQMYLQNILSNTKIFDLYESRAKRSVEAITEFANAMSASAGKPFAKFGSPSERITAAAHKAIETLTQRRKERAGRLYQQIWDQGVEVDLQPLVTRLDEIINDGTQSLMDREAATKFKAALSQEREALVDGKKVTVLDPLTSMEAVNNRKIKDINALFQSEPVGARKLLSSLKMDLDSIMDEAAPLYAFAKRVYDPTKPNIQATERSAIGAIARIFDDPRYDKQAPKALKEIFNPDVSERSLRNAKRVLRAIDPQAWQDIKGHLIKNKLDDITKEHLKEKGVGRFQEYFAQPKVARMMEIVLEPDELARFNKLNEVLDLAFHKVPRPGSLTQPLQEYGKSLGLEGEAVANNAFSLLLKIMNMPGKTLAGQIGQQYIDKVAYRQKQAYFDRLIDVLLSEPGSGAQLHKAYHYFDKLSAGTLQVGTRGAAEGLGITDSVGRDPNYDPLLEKEKMLEKDREAADQMLDDQSSINAPMPSFDPLPPSAGRLPPRGPISSAVLPRVEDREMAQAMRGGIGGLV